MSSTRNFRFSDEVSLPRRNKEIRETARSVLRTVERPLLPVRISKADCHLSAPFRTLAFAGARSLCTTSRHWLNGEFRSFQS